MNDHVYERRPLWQGLLMVLLGAVVLGLPWIVGIVYLLAMVWPW